MIYRELGKNYIWLPGPNAWYSEKDDAINLTWDDIGLPNTERGMWVTFNGNPKSANYHPGNFNRINFALEQLGAPHRGEPMPDGERRIGKRTPHTAKSIQDLVRGVAGDDPQQS